ncbi:MAG: asparagine synthase (glutamine-hydrolyzing) [Nitrospirae bacterium]|nr:asparagine synthase (glutamine-hydrolyzing) [Nitrospirota bacterium]
MCGIAGIVAYHYAALDVDRRELRRMRDRMVARGPDGEGEWYSADNRVGLGHRRLAIIDLDDRASQPMRSADGKLVIAFNGEIYNYRDLRERLEAKGYVFRTQSDTEVLLQLYADKGAAMVGDLRGMFAFGLWDGRKEGLLLARDPYGIKPLYYADDGWTFRFASQVKALLAGGKVSRDPEPAGHVGFYLFGAVPEPYTIWQDIRAVPAGSTLWVDEIGSSEPRPYYSLAQVYTEAQEKPLRLDEPDLRLFAREAFLDSVRHHLVADVPVGAFLSAGIDSGSLVGLMRDTGQSDIQTVTLTFSEFSGKPGDEAPLAEQVAKQYGTSHTTRIVTASEFRDDMPRILAAMDQPSIDGINTWFVSKAARELGLKVAISGLGGDELLAGYPSFERIPGLVRRLALPSRIPWLGRLVRTIGRQVIPGRFKVHPKALSALEYGGTYPGAYLLIRGLFMPGELDEVLDQDMVREGLRRLRPLHYIGEFLKPDPLIARSRVAVLESGLYMRHQLLRDTDWASMAHSLEVRTPLVDSQLVKRLLPALVTPTTVQAKDLLAQSPSLALPEQIRTRTKTGFSIPVTEWVAGDSVLRKGIGTRQWAHIVASA